MKRIILIFLFPLFGQIIIAQTEIEKVNSTVSKNEIESQIYFLASDELKGRETGSQEIDIAAAYLANMLRKYGVKPIGENNSYYQNVQLEKISPAKHLEIELNN